MGLLRKIWNWIFGSDPLDEIFVEPGTIKKLTLKPKKESIYQETVPDKYTPVVAYKRSNGKMIYKLVCCKCKKKSNTSSLATAKRKKYLCQSCSDKRTGRKKQ